MPARLCARGSAVCCEEQRRYPGIAIEEHDNLPAWQITVQQILLRKRHVFTDERDCARAKPPDVGRTFDDDDGTGGAPRLRQTVEHLRLLMPLQVKYLGTLSGQSPTKRACQPAR